MNVYGPFTRVAVLLVLAPLLVCVGSCVSPINNPSTIGDGGTWEPGYLDDDVKGDAPKRRGNQDVVAASDGAVVDVKKVVPGCVKTDPATETCDGVDNDCDGVTDSKTACDSGNPCIKSTCDAKLAADTGDGCINENLDGAACDDGSACSTNDNCLNGGCKGAPKNCDDGSPCTVDNCKASTGKCENVPLPPGQKCNDGNACTDNDTCTKDGACVGQSSAQCDDGNPCTKDGCDNNGKCVYQQLSEGTCDDANPCTDKDVCLAGKCVSGGPKVCDDGNACTDDFCDIANGGCVTKPKTFGTSCTPSNKCMGKGSCNEQGLCVGAAKCDDNKICTIDTCDQADGKCTNTPLQKGTPCDDNVPCTSNTMCTADGVCDSGGQKGCDDGNPCTVDQCADPVKQTCKHTPMFGNCDDGDACTQGEKCVASKCVAGPSLKVETVAGSGKGTWQDGNGTTAAFYHPRGVAFALDGSLFIADSSNNRIRQVEPNGKVSTIAGQAAYGFQDGWGTSAKFYKPQGIALDKNGALYVADWNNHRIRKVVNGQVTTVAGSTKGYKDGSGTGALFQFPDDVAVDGAGNLFVADSYNHRIRKIDPQGTVTTVAGGIAGMADGLGTAAKFNRPAGIAVDTAGVLWVSDSLNHVIRRIAANGMVSTFAGSGANGWADGPGKSASFYDPHGLEIDAGGNLYVADAGNHSVRRIDNKGFVTTLAGLNQKGYLDGNGGLAKFDEPHDVAIGKDGLVFIADNNNHRIRKAAPSSKLCTDGQPCTLDGCDDKTGACTHKALKAGDPCDDGSKCTTKEKWDFAGKCSGTSKDCNDKNDCTTDTCNSFTGECAYAKEVKPCDDGNKCTDGDLCAGGKCTAGAGTVSTWAGSGIKGNANGQGNKAQFNDPARVAAAIDGTLYVSDHAGNRIRKIDPKGNVTTFAGSIPGYLDGAAAQAKFNGPSGIAVELSGNVYVADRNNHRIRKIDPKGNVSTLSGSYSGFADGEKTKARFFYPEDVEVDNAGNVYVADSYNNRIRKVTAQGYVTTIAGSNQSYADGKGAKAYFHWPFALAMDNKGALIVADRNNQRIRRVDQEGNVTTLAGKGTTGAADGQGVAASFNNPESLAIDPFGQILIADRSNNRIRRMTPDGFVVTLSGQAGSGHQDCDAVKAKFSGPGGIAAAKDGSVYVADRANNRIRKMAPTHKVCDDGKGCTADACDVKTAKCSHKVIKAGQSCTDGNACTQKDVCDDKNQCVGVKKNCSDGNDCSLDVCNPYNGACLHSPQDVPCSDGDFCTSADQCMNGKCIGDIGDLKTIAGSGKGGYADGAGSQAMFNRPFGVDADGKANVYVADQYNQRIRKITPNGDVSTLAGSTGGWQDGTGAAARFNYPYDVAATDGGVVYVADRNNHRIRMVTPEGKVTTVAGTGSSSYKDGPALQAYTRYPSGLDVDKNNTVYFTDYYYKRIRRLSNGVVDTIAGSGSTGYVDAVGKKASFYYPYDVAVDSKGNLFVADTYNHLIRHINPAGVVTTLAGTPQKGGFADLKGKDAKFYYPYGIAVNNHDEVFVADRSNNRIRKVFADGNVITVAGTGATGWKDGPALQGNLNQPYGLGFGPNDEMYIADSNNYRVRYVSSPYKTCSDGTECTIDSCNAKTGKCEHVIVPDGSPCVGDKPCLDKRLCNMGICVGGLPKKCDDKNSCTVDSCDKVTGKCVFKPGPNCKVVRRVFLTSQKYHGNLGNIYGADAKCQQQASAAKLGGKWMAWLSSSSGNPLQRFNKASVPYVLINGVIIAQNWNDLVDGSLQASINVDETGLVISSTGNVYCKSLTGPKVWTNTKTNGGLYSSSSKYSCANWATHSTSSYYRPVLGMANRTDGTWTYHHCSSNYARCSSPYLGHLYCFEQSDHFAPK